MPTPYPRSTIHRCMKQFKLEMCIPNPPPQTFNLLIHHQKVHLPLSANPNFWRSLFILKTIYKKMRSEASKAKLEDATPLRWHIVRVNVFRPNSKPRFDSFRYMLSRISKLENRCLLKTQYKPYTINWTRHTTRKLLASIWVHLAPPKLHPPTESTNYKFVTWNKNFKWSNPNKNDSNL